MSMGRIVAAVAVVAVIAAAAFCGASGHAAGNGVSSSGPGAVKLCGCQCISAAGAGSAAGVGTDVVLVAVKPHISGPGKAGRDSRRLIIWKMEEYNSPSKHISRELDC